MLIMPYNQIMKARNRLITGLMALSSIFVLSLTSCAWPFFTKTKKKISDYQYIFNAAYDWSKTVTCQPNELFSYGEYRYNSYLLLVPRQTPSTLQSFFYRWESGGFDVDVFGFSFSCKLEKDSFNNYVNGLNTFNVKVEDIEQSLIKIEDKFDYPTYLVQWEPYSSLKWQLLEYIMVDQSSFTVVYVYSFSSGYEELKKNVSYNIAPNVELSDIHNRFSICKNPETYNAYPLKDLVYDNSFIDYLL